MFALHRLLRANAYLTCGLTDDHGDSTMRTRTNPFVLMAGLYLTVGLLALFGKLAVEVGAIETLPRLRWLLVHFVTIGAMTQALFGALPNLLASVTDTETTFPSRGRWLQWLALNAGFPLLLVGMATSSTTTAVTGGTAILTALVLLLASATRTVLGESSSGLLGRYYVVAPSFLVVGIFAAFGLLLNVHGPGGYFGTIEAHVHANVWGFLALVVAGTLLAITPEVAGVTLRYPRLTRVTFWGLVVGAAGLVAGPWLAVHALTFTGLAVYVVGTVALLVNVVATRRSNGCEPDSRFAHVLGAYLWLVFPVPWAPLVLLFPDVVPAVAIETAAIDGLVFGWMLQLAMGLLPSVATAFHDDGPVAIPKAVASSPHRPSWTGVVTVNVGMLAIWLTAVPTLADVAELLTLGGFTLVAVAWLRFLPGLWRVLVGGSERVRPEDEDPARRSRETLLD